MKIASANRSVDELTELGYAGFSDHRRATGAVSSDSAVMTRKISTLEVAKAGGAIS
jgi:hypothetical protein